MEKHTFCKLFLSYIYIYAYVNKIDAFIHLIVQCKLFTNIHINSKSKSFTGLTKMDECEINCSQSRRFPFEYFVAESNNYLWKVLWFSRSDIFKSHGLILKNRRLIYFIYGKTKFRFKYYATDPI